MRSAWIPELLDNHYAIYDAEVALMRSHTSDVFKVTTPTNSYVLKAYHSTWRAREEVEYEVALLQHLTSKGLSVANVTPATNGHRVVSVPDEDDSVVLFEYAAGEKPRPPFGTKLYQLFGRSIAQVHEYSNDFYTTLRRRPLDLTFMIEEPLSVTLPQLHQAADRKFVQETARKISSRITDLASHGLDWGPIHGDATLDNLHVTKDCEIILYDFDSGGPGWRAADLQGWAWNRAEYNEKRSAFKQGYGSVRELHALDLKAAPYFAVAWLLWGIQVDLEQRLLKQGRETVQKYLAEQLNEIRAQAELLPG